MLEDQLKGTARRKPRNGYLYSKEQFLHYYGEDGHDLWQEADERLVQTVSRVGLSNGAAEPIADRLISTTFNKLKRTVVEAMALQSLLQTVALASVILQRVRACWRIL